MELYQAILIGFREQLRSDGIYKPGRIGLHESILDEQIVVAVDYNNVADGYPCGACDGHVLKLDDGHGPFFDDLTKQQLPSELTKLARRKEIEYVESIRQEACTHI